MTQKKKIPWGVFFIILAAVLLGAYLVSGLFMMDGVTVKNYQEKLSYILFHPFTPWWNERTPAFMGVGVILWVMGVSYYLTYHRNFHPESEHGVAEWEDVRKAAKRLRDKEETRNTYVSRNIRIGFDALSNMNMLIIGGSGSGKTTSELIPNLLHINMTNIILDIKGDLLKKYGAYLKHIGVTVKAINFKNPLESHRFNPFCYIKNYSDLIGIITNIQQSVKPPDAMKGDPFWDDGVALYLQSLFEYEWLLSQKQGYTGTMNHILDLVNMETKTVDEDGTTALQQEMDSLARVYGEDYPPVRDYRKLKEGATETVRSIIIMVNAQLKLFEIPEIRRIFEDDDIDIPSLGLGIDNNPEKKTALFLVMRSGDTSYNLFINMFYTLLFRVLRDIADNDCPGGKLPIHVRLWADEFYAGPKPADAEMLLGEIRSRNMSMVPILQDIAQIKTLFPNDKWEIFTGNCAAMIYLGSGPTAHTTHQWISDMLEDMTIDTRSESMGYVLAANSNSNLQMQKAGMKLMTPGQVSRMPKDDCILFLEGYRPIYDKKNWPFHTKEFQQAERAAGKQGYTNPVRVIYNEKTGQYKTLEGEEKLRILSEEEFAFFKEAEKTDDSIKTFEMDMQQFLYTNWKEIPHPTEEEIRNMIQNIPKKDITKMEPPEDVYPFLEEEDYDRESEEEKPWDLSGSVVDCLLRYAEQLSPEEIEEIIGGMEDGLSDKEIKKYFALHDVEKMRQYHRAVTAGW
ncbi:hypothetical protein B5E53_10440 [Eubacterium sp. An11]|uniref:VirD4-like conjugal transfer protein, CD1115 family n=1 Tax=Eubacterium sp. An11 TaxID=1965542 RepID=UPI000B3A95AF|nr:type IV secretory system conjugative DNA transfer family protein [Eubacterium sp. An11]OUQ66445.1 hypothetical protein B5E53_10440 [Eubacterium sp. An11]